MIRARDYRAILMDLDGTLLDRGGALAPESREAVRAAVDAGLEVWLATGRSVSATRGVYNALGLATPACCYNGALLYDGPSARWLRHHPVADDLLSDLVEFALARSLFFLVFHEDVKYAAAPVPAHMRPFLDLLDEVRVVAPEALPRAGATKFSMAGEEADLRGLEERLGGRGAYVVTFPVGLIPGFESYTWTVVDLHAPCRGKAEAIHFLEEERGIAPAEVIAIGDHRNDLPMIRAAGLGVAMENAPEDVKREARLVIGHHDRGGVAEFLRGLLSPE
jgi:Cof subfamily protein (haloacid dehalogenase superfamily)